MKTREEALTKIESLPRDHQEVYRAALELLASSALEEGSYEERRAAEREACGASAMSPLSKAAQGFFFVREISDRLSRGIERRVPRRTILRGVASQPSAIRTGKDESFSFEMHAEGEPAVEVHFDDEIVSAKLYFDRAQSPIEGAAVRIHGGLLSRAFFEVCGDERQACAIHAGLERARQRSVRTTRFVSDELLDALVHPIRAALDAGHCAPSVARALREFGMVSLPMDSLFERIPEVLLATTSEDEKIAPIIASLIVSILGFCAANLANSSLLHPAVADVLTVDLLSYPVTRESPCRGANLSRIADLLTSDPNLGRFVPEQYLAATQAYVEGGRAFFRG